MDSDRQTTVLFADLTGSTRLYELAGDNDALAIIGRCMETLRRAAEAAGGRVIKTIGDEVMALFAAPDSAADAATRMHIAIEALAFARDHKLAVRIGFHSGPVIQQDNDVFGDTVNLASRLVEQATRGQILTSAETVSFLTPAIRSATRELYDITVKGKVKDIGLCELLWRKSADITHVPLGQKAPRSQRRGIRLRHRGKDVVLRRRVESFTLGRDASCNLVIFAATASRDHCVIERRHDNFVVRDHSSNGTFVAVEGDATESILRREEMALRGHGWLAFGQPREQAEDLVEFWCD